MLAEAAIRCIIIFLDMGAFFFSLSLSFSLSIYTCFAAVTDRGGIRPGSDWLEFVCLSVCLFVCLSVSQCVVASVFRSVFLTDRERGMRERDMTVRQASRQAGGQSDRQADRQTDRNTERHREQ